MNKRVAVGIVVSVMLLVVLSGSILATEWDDYTNTDTPVEIPATDVVEDGTLDPDSLNYAVFETYGPLLLVMAMLMFGAIIGGVCIAREEVDEDDTN